MVIGMVYPVELIQSFGSSFSYILVSEARKLSCDLLKDHYTSHISEVRLYHYTCDICGYHIIVPKKNKIKSSIFEKQKLYCFSTGLPHFFVLGIYRHREHIFISFNA